jgi:galactokinase
VIYLIKRAYNKFKGVYYIMQNVKTTIKGNKLIIEVDITKDFGLSASGKTISIASTKGNKDVHNGVIVGLNVYKFPNK